MARIRTVKPEFFKSDDLADLSPLHRLLFIGLWCLADREGRLEDKPRRIKAELLPYDTCDVSELLDQLAEAHFIQRYEAENVSCIVVTNFKKHQRINGKEAEQQSALPAPPHALSGEEMGKHPGSTRNPRKGREGKGTCNPLTPQGEWVDEDLPFSEPPEPLRPDEEPELRLTTPALLKPATPAPKPVSLPDFSDDRFQAFKEAYVGHRKVKWAKALEVWKRDKLGSDERFPLVMQALEEDKASRDWLKEGGAYIPGPWPWLNSRRWADVVATVAKANPYEQQPWGPIWTQTGWPENEIGVMNFASKLQANPYEAREAFRNNGFLAAVTLAWQHRRQAI